MVPRSLLEFEVLGTRWLLHLCPSYPEHWPGTQEVLSSACRVSERMNEREGALLQRTSSQTREPSFFSMLLLLVLGPHRHPHRQVLAVPSKGPGPTGTKPGLRLGGPAPAQAEAANRLEISFVKACAAFNLL